MEDRFALIRAAIFFQPRRLGEIQFTTDEGLDPFGFRLIVELDRAVQIAVVGERHRAHPELGCALDQPVNPAATVEQTVVRVNMKVDEIFVGGRQGPKASRGAMRGKRFSESNQGRAAALGEIEWRPS